MSQEDRERASTSPQVMIHNLVRDVRLVRVPSFLSASRLCRCISLNSSSSRVLSRTRERKNVSGAILMFQLRYMKNIVSFRFSDPKGIGSDGYISDDLRERAEKRVARW